MQKEQKVVITLAVIILVLFGIIMFISKGDGITGSTVMKTLIESEEPVDVVENQPHLLIKEALPADATPFSLADTLLLDGYEIRIYHNELKRRAGENINVGDAQEGTYLILHLKAKNIANRDGYFPEDFLAIYVDDVRYDVQETVTGQDRIGLYNLVLRKEQNQNLKAIFDVPEESNYQVRLSPKEGPVLYATLEF